MIKHKNLKKVLIVKHMSFSIYCCLKVPEILVNNNINAYLHVSSSYRKHAQNTFYRLHARSTEIKLWNFRCDDCTQWRSLLKSKCSNFELSRFCRTATILLRVECGDVIESGHNSVVWLAPSRVTYGWVNE